MFAVFFFAPYCFSLAIAVLTGESTSQGNLRLMKKIGILGTALSHWGLLVAIVMVLKMNAIMGVNKKEELEVATIIVFIVVMFINTW